MTNLLGQILTAKLQCKGIFPDNYEGISKAVYSSLLDLVDDMAIDDTLEMPDGSTLKLVFKPNITI